MTIFANDAASNLARVYPQQSTLLKHRLDQHELLSLEALARLGTELPKTSVSTTLERFQSELRPRM